MVGDQKKPWAKLVPWGTPTLTGFQSEKNYEESFTLCNLPLKKSEIEFKIEGLRPSSNRFA
jgi:hypothetical protein